MINLITAHDINNAALMWEQLEALWQPIPRLAEMQSFVDNHEKELSKDGAGIFYLRKKTIARMQYGGSEKIVFPNRLIALAAWKFFSRMS